VTEDEIRELATAWAKRTAIEQGLRPRVMDIAALRQVVCLLGWSSSSDRVSSERTLAQPNTASFGRRLFCDVELVRGLGRSIRGVVGWRDC
jgi:hypothetical protein